MCEVIMESIIIAKTKNNSKELLKELKEIIELAYKTKFIDDNELELLTHACEIDS